MRTGTPRPPVRRDRPPAHRARGRSFRRAAVLALALGATLLPTLALAAPEKADGGIRFTYTDPNAGAIFWAGEFNGWSTSAHPMAKDATSAWSVVIALPPGQHQYKFVVDGQWVADPENSATAGEFGNSVVRVAPDGSLEALQATSNTAYSPKILVGGRVIGLYQTIYNQNRSRYEMTRPTFDIDLDLGVKISDVLRARMLLNINPEHENVQDYRSRLNFKRGSLYLAQPGFDVTAFDSENLGTWDDPLHLVGNVGVFAHPYGYRRQGVRLGLQKLGFDAEVLYTDNFDDRLLTNSDLYLGYRIDNFPTFSIGPVNEPRYVFETDPVGRALALLATERTATGFALIPGQATKIATLDFGDNDRLFGYGDNNENMFAARVRRKLPGHWTAGLLGRGDRGFGLGRLVYAEPEGDSTVRVVNALYSQQWYGAGVEAAWQPRANLRAYGEVLAGTRRMGFVNGSTTSWFPVTTIGASGVRASRAPDSVRVLTADGDHLTTDESIRFRIGGAWSFASGDIGLRADLERETHKVPHWNQSPVIPAGLPPDDHARFETVEFQRSRYLRAGDELDNAATTWRLGWDRNWRWYLNREVKTTLDLEWTNFSYDERTAWEHQIWFPTGNLWLESGQHLVSVDRLTVLGEEQAIRLKPVFEIPIARKRDLRFTYRGTFSGVGLDKRPRYAESIFQLGFDLGRTVRFNSDTRWVKYDAPALGLGSGYVSEFAEIVVRFSPLMHVSFGWGVDPNVLDPNTNEYAYIGRDVFLNQRNANGFIAETNYTSLAPQISAAERALQNEDRFQIQAVVRF